MRAISRMAMATGSRTGLLGPAVPGVVLRPAVPAVVLAAAVSGTMARLERARKGV